MLARWHEGHNLPLRCGTPVCRRVAAICRFREARSAVTDSEQQPPDRVGRGWYATYLWALGDPPISVL